MKKIFGGLFFLSPPYITVHLYISSRRRKRSYSNAGANANAYGNGNRSTFIDTNGNGNTYTRSNGKAVDTRLRSGIRNCRAISSRLRGAAKEEEVKA